MVQTGSPVASLSPPEYKLLVGLALIKLGIHFYTNTFAGYEIFRDELYYLACARHLDFGYVDHPPLSILILALNTMLFGDGLFALRLLPALTGAANVFLVGLLARELGGGRFAQSIAGLAALVSLIYLAFGGIYSMNAFDLLLWTLAAFFLARLVRTGDRRLWIPVGLVLGLGLLNKTSVLWLGAGLGAALVLTTQRRWLKTKWPWLAAGIAFVLFSPYVIWNYAHDFAHLEFIQNASAGKYSGLSAWTFLTGALLANNPVIAPIWVCGAIFLFRTNGWPARRFLAIIFWTVTGLLVLNGHSKSEYLAAASCIPFAGAGVVFEQWLAGGIWRRLRPAVVAVMLSGLLLTPVVLPILPVQTYIAYAETLGIQPSTAEGLELAELPQFYADMFGWRNMAATVAGVYAQLPVQERSGAVVLGLNYGEAGTIDYHRGEYDLPPVIGRHNNYWVWGWGTNPKPPAVIIIGGTAERHAERCGEVEEAAVIRSPYSIPYENNLPVFVCRNLKMSLEEIWPLIKVYH